MKNDNLYQIVEASFNSDDKTRAYYAWRARGYDKATTYEISHHTEAVRLADIHPGDHILEVACGTGRATVELAKRLGPEGKLDAIDLSPDMMAIAQSKVTDLGVINKVEFKTGNAGQLPYESGSFDILYNSYMFDLIPLSQFGAILAEFRRVLKPGGRLVLVNMSKSRPGKTLYESLYEKIRRFPCRPVILSDYVKAAGFIDVQRRYYKSYTSFIPLPFGTEIVTGRRAVDNS